MLRSVNSDKVITFLLCVLCFFPIFPFALTSIVLIVSLALGILLKYKNFKENYSTLGLQPFINLSLFFILLIVSISYSDYRAEGVKELQKGIPMLLIPFVFLYFIRKLVVRNIKLFLGCFIIANILFIFYFYQFSITKLSEYSKFTIGELGYVSQWIEIITMPFGEILKFAVNAKNEPFPIFFHKAYHSMFILFCIVVLVRYLMLNFKQNRYKRSAGALVLILFFSYFLVHWFSIPNLAAISIIIVAMILFLVPKKVKYAMLVGMLMLPFLYNTSFVQNKIENNYTLKKNIRQLTTFLRAPFEPTLQSDAIRVTVYDCGFSLIKSAPVLGYGLGSANKELATCYIEKEYKRAKAYNLNSHNYYLHLWLSGGILCLLAFIVYIIKNMIKTIQRKHYIYFALIVIVLCNVAAENILYRSYGAVFFAFFNTLFFIDLYTNKEKKEF